MKIALVDSFPNLLISAEQEFIHRASVALRNLGHEAICVVTSNDIIDAQPDLVLVTHEFSPKLTDHPTLGLMWSPAVFYRGDPFRVRNILIYDGYLSGSPAITQYLTDLLFQAGKRCPIREIGYSSCFRPVFQERSRSDQPYSTPESIGRAEFQAAFQDTGSRGAASHLRTCRKLEVFKKRL